MPERESGQSARASMRPGQLTPENPASPQRFLPPSESFNEAGAINPGKRRASKRLRTCSRSFNEAGAINPGKRRGFPVMTEEQIWLQ